MSRRIRIAAVAAALGAACLVLTTIAPTVTAAEPEFAGYQASGQARGLQLGFSFTDFVLDKIVDIGVPHAEGILSSEGGGQGRAVASQVFPGGVIAGAAGEQFPGYREANYPANVPIDAEDDISTVPALFQQNLPSNFGPIQYTNSRLTTLAQKTHSAGRAITQNLALLMGDIPLIEIGQLHSVSDATNEDGKLVQTSRTTASGIKINLSDAVAVTIDNLRSFAKSSSDGEAGAAEASITLGDVNIVVAGQTFAAAIDQDGIRLAGAPDQVPPFIPQSLRTDITQAINQAAIAVRTGTVVEIVEGAVGDASVSGLIIEVSGRIPNLFVPEAVAGVQAQIYEGFPTICFQRDISPNFPVPLCVTPQLIPGPGQGAIASFAIGPVRAATAAAPAFVFDPGGPTDGGPGAPIDGGLVPPTDTFVPTDPGVVAPPQAGQPQAQGPLFGRVARMHSGILVGTGFGFLVFAVAFAMGPSLRRWRSAVSP